MKFLLGKKVGMTQIFNKEGGTIPVTLLEVGPCKVLQVKTKEKDGYETVQIGFEQLKKETKSAKGKGFRYIKEFPMQNTVELGTQLDVSLFKEGDRVKVTGVSKGKGFQGGVKKWGFTGRNQTRGVKHEHRTLGSVGAARPSEVWKGKKMPGRMGFGRVSVKNLEVVKIDAGKNLLAVRGAVPGKPGTLISISAL